MSMPDPTNPTELDTGQPVAAEPTVETPPAADEPIDDISVIDQAIADANAMEGEAPAPPKDPEPEGEPEPVPAADGEPPVEEPAPAAEGDPEPEPAPSAEKDEAVEREMADLKIDKPSAQARFRELSSENARLRPLEAKAQQWETFEGMVQSTKATPAQFGDALGVLRAINSDDPQMLTAVYDKLERELSALGKRIGREAPGYDPLDDHPDLKTKVAEQDIARADALEIAKHRTTGRLVETRNQEQVRTETQKAQFNEALNSAMQEMNAYEDEIKALDPHYESKKSMLVPTLQPVFANIHPSKWLATFKQAYLAMPAPTAAAPPAAPAAPARPAPLRNQPLRPTGAPAAVLSPEVKTELDAIEAGIAAANRANGIA